MENPAQENFFPAYLKYARRKDRDAAFTVGRAYLFGRGVPPDLKKGLAWLSRAERWGHPFAPVLLAQCAAEGACSHPMPTTSQLATLVQLAGEKNTDAMYYLGMAREGGLGLPQDLSEACRLYRESGARGNAEGAVACGRMAEEGKGCEQDLSLAVTLYDTAAKAENPEAQYRLGMLYQSGTGVKQDKEKATRLLLLSAAQNYPEALRHFGMECNVKKPPLPWGQMLVPLLIAVAACLFALIWRQIFPAAPGQDSSSVTTPPEPTTSKNLLFAIKGDPFHYVEEDGLRYTGMGTLATEEVRSVLSLLSSAYARSQPPEAGTGLTLGRVEQYDLVRISYIRQDAPDTENTMLLSIGADMLGPELDRLLIGYFYSNPFEADVSFAGEDAPVRITVTPLEYYDFSELLTYTVLCDLSGETSIYPSMFGVTPQTQDVYTTVCNRVCSRVLLDKIANRTRFHFSETNAALMQDLFPGGVDDAYVRRYALAMAIFEKEGLSLSPGRVNALFYQLSDDRRAAFTAYFRMTNQAPLMDTLSPTTLQEYAETLAILEAVETFLMQTNRCIF